jgi:signal transduction histidine kinase/ActR/RegA family two-component response regulator
LEAGTRVVVADLEDGRTGSDSTEQEVFRRSGVRAVQTTPLVTRNGTTVGLLSTYWRQPRAPTEREGRWFDLLARQVADLLERTEAVAALRRSERELKEADRRKNEFLAVLAHELRNPLAPVRTGLELMRLAGDNRFAVERVRGMMERQVAHMVRLIDDLLDVSRITSGKIRLQREISLLPELVQGAIEASRAGLTAGRFELAVDLPSDPVWLDVDPTRFVQVVSNLLHNALKFSEDGGRIAIAGRVVDDPAGAGKELMLTVTDSGMGISREMLPRVFDLFTQDESAVNRSNTGLGIGLALASRLMSLHGGSIEAASDGPGLGSTFTVRMPVVHDRAAPAPPRPGQGPHATARSVLVIDDNADAANTTAMLVETLGGSCEVAYDGASGFAKALVLRPDVILLDIGMPGMDGYQTCRKIRSALGQEVVIVAVTGWGQEQDKDEAYRAGFNAHLTKPADPAALEHLLAADTGGETGERQK